MQVVLYNLPHDVQESAVRALLGEREPVYSVSLDQDSQHHATAVITLATCHEHALQLSERLNGQLVDGQVITAWAPVMPWASPWPTVPVGVFSQAQTPPPEGPSILPSG